MPSNPTAAPKTPLSRKTLVARAVAAAAAVLAVILLAYALFGGGPAGTHVDYRDFSALLDRGDVAGVVIGADGNVSFTLGSSAEGGGAAALPSGARLENGPFYTENPGAPDFKERLLLAGVEVSEEADAGAVFDAVLNLLFFAVFFGGIAFAASRLVSLDRTTFRLVRKTGVTFADIAGMDELKRELVSVVDVLKNPGRYAERGIRPVKGIVLEGPPGNGKTLFAKALADEAGVNFIATKGADFQSALMSLGARKIRMLFSKAARHTPCIVFIDEFDSIGERRSYAGTGIDKENNRIITAMLNEMDGFTGREGILVVAATNSYASLDAALVRPGRFDLRFTVGNPDYATRLELLDLYAPGKNLAADLTHDVLARAFDGMSCAAIESVLNEAASLAALEGSGTTTREHVQEAVRRVCAA